MGDTKSRPVNLTQQTLKGAAWLGGASAVRLGLRVISVAILARLVTPTEYGIVAGATFVMDFAAMIYTVGLASTLVQFKEIQREHVATAFSTSLVLSLVAGTAVWLGAPGISELMGIPELAEILRVLVFVMPFGSFATLCESLLARNMKLKSVALRQLVGFIIASFLVGVPLALAGYGYWALVAMLASEVVAGAAALALISRNLLVWPSFSRAAFAELWPISLGFSINKPFVYLASNIDKFLIARLSGAEALGFYTRAGFLVTNATHLFSNIARVALFAAMAQVQMDKERLRRALLKSLSLTALVTIPASAFCIVFAPELVGLLLGKQWGVAVRPFAILSLALYLRLSRRTLDALYQAIGRPYWLTGLRILNITLIVPGVLLVLPHGIDAVCMVLIAIMALIYLLTLFMACRFIELGPKDLAVVHFSPLLLATFIGTVGTVLKSLLWHQPDVVVLTAGAVVIGGAILFAARLNPEKVLGSLNRDMLPVRWKS
jgi:O-antigen/teichoic acid export membrane protein